MDEDSDTGGDQQDEGREEEASSSPVSDDGDDDEVPELISDESEYETLEEDEYFTVEEVEVQRREGGARLIPRILQMFRQSTSRRDDTDTADNSEGGGERADVTFDLGLPGQHLYLGTGSEVQGRTVFDEHEVRSLPLLFYPHFVLMPGQQFPLTLFDTGLINMVRTVLAGNKTFGLISAHSGSPNSKGAIGTTAEIFEYGEVGQEEGQILGFKIKAKGRQRFRLLSTHTDPSGQKVGLVSMLPEISVTSPLTPLYTSRLRSCDRKGEKAKRLNLQAMSPFPTFVHMMYDSQTLVQRVHSSLRCYGWYSDHIPSDPEDLSWWLASNLPIQDTWKYHLLGINSAIQRLRVGLCILSMIQVLVCRRCSSVLADQSDIFSMSAEGPQGAFVNPGGHLHETLTVYKAKSLKLVGNSSTEYSWFPGYAWTIVECARCFNHIGWKFTAAKENLKPDKFYGFSRKSISSDLGSHRRGNVTAGGVENREAAEIGENDIALAEDQQPDDMSLLVM